MTGGKSISRARSVLAALSVLLCSSALAQKEPAAGFGVPLYPGAIPRPEVARAVEAYYRPGITEDQVLTAAVYETPAAFQRVYDFYGPRMERGKWGWRRKTRYLIQQTDTLKYMRAELVAKHREGGQGYPTVFEAFFGDRRLGEREFNGKLDELRKKQKETKIQVVEGTRPIRGDPAESQVRITVERPYIDLEKMKLIDRTRIVFVKVSRKSVP